MGVMEAIEAPKKRDGRWDDVDSPQDGSMTHVSSQAQAKHGKDSGRSIEFSQLSGPSEQLNEALFTPPL